MGTKLWTLKHVIWSFASRFCNVRMCLLWIIRWVWIYRRRYSAENIYAKQTLLAFVSVHIGTLIMYIIYEVLKRIASFKSKIKKRVDFWSWRLFLLLSLLSVILSLFYLTVFVWNLAFQTSTIKELLEANMHLWKLSMIRI